MSNEKVFFFHLPKAGGTSIISTLHSLRDWKISPIIENNALQHSELSGIYDYFRGYDVYAGHYGYDLYRAVADGHAIMTNFRSPVDRIVSLYRYFRYVVGMEPDDLALPHNRAIWAAKNLSFEEFVSSRDENVLIYISDFHFRQLCHSPWEIQCDAPMSTAKDIINEMSCVFVCEYPEQSNYLFTKKFGLSNIPRINVTCAPDDVASLLTARARENILSVNERDIAIYDFAVSRFMLPLAA